MSIKKYSWFQQESFIDMLLGNRYFQLVMTIFVVLSTLGIAFGYILIFWSSFVLFSAGLFVAIVQERSKLKIYHGDFIPVPIVINISNSANSKNALNHGFSLIEENNEYRHHKKNLEKIFHLKEDDLVFEFQGDIKDQEKLKDFLKIVKHDVEKLENKIPAKDEFYIIYIGPVSVAILVGVIFANSAVKVLQYDKSANGYTPVCEIKGREIKENVKSFEKFDVETPFENKSNNKKAILAIDISSHKIDLHQLQTMHYGDVFYLKAKNDKGTLAMNEDWERYAKEIFKELKELQGKGYKEIKLVYSMPVSIGLMIGIAIQNYWRIMLTQYKDGSYEDVIFVNEVKYYL